MTVSDQPQEGSTDLTDPASCDPADSNAPTPSTGERRIHPRYTTEGDAEIAVLNGSSLFRGRILNISETGCYIQSLAYVQLAPATEVRILFVLNAKVITVSAEARTSTPKVGIGFQFLDVDNRTRSLLKTIVANLRLQQGV